MSVNIDRPTLLKEKMQSGINLFTGAGFSCLPNSLGEKLPTASELCSELCDKFSLPITLSDDLEALSELAPKQQLQDHLRSRFTVSEYNPLYNALNKVALLTYVTTNIDNLIHKVIDKSPRYFLNSITYYGASKNGYNELEYIPLHGDVSDPNSRLYFGKFDLSTVDTSNTDLFQLMHGRLLKHPVLFWGYGFHDSGVLKTVSRLLEHNPHDIWIQCIPDDKRNIELFKAKGCNIIEADTQELLMWIDDELNSPLAGVEGSLVENKLLKRYRIPSISQVESIPINDYYQQGNTHWHPILSNRAFEFSIVNDIYELALKYSNIVLSGGGFTGKTTTLMQLASKVDYTDKFFVEKLTAEQARFIAAQIGSKEAWMFYHNCAEDIEAFKVFAVISNIHLIGIAEDYQLESTKHLLSGIIYKNIEIDELDKRQAQLMYECIPESIRVGSFAYKDVSSEKFSMFEMISKNVRGVDTRNRVQELLRHMYGHDMQAFDTVSLATYLSDNGSALSTDVMMAYFSPTSYNDVKVILDKAKSLLSEYNVVLTEDEADQDFFLLRSKLFAYYANNILVKDRWLRERYGIVIEKFIRDVMPYRIFRYDIFRRKAFDSDLFFDLYGDHANDIYSYLYNYNQNPYTLQQWSLYRAKLKQYSQAFIDIDKALSQRPNNFSMRNSQAIILFEANMEQGTSLSIEKMKKAMEILRTCYNNDKRKVYHAQKYAEFSIILTDRYAVNQYLNEAFRWIDEVSQHGDSMSRRTKHLREELGKRIK